MQESASGELIERSVTTATSDRRRSMISWSVIAAITFLAFELSGSLFLAGFVFCLKFAVHDVMTAVWLVRTDPIVSRGSTCAMLLCAWGLFKAAFVGHVGMPLIAAVTTLFVPAGGLNQMLELSEVGLAFALADAVGIGLCTVLTWVAAGMALRAQRRIWVDSSLSLSRRHQMWPPDCFRKNRTELLVWFAAFGSAILGVLAVLWFVETAGLAQEPGPRMLVLFGSLFIAMLLVPFAIIRLEQIVASTPEECWPELSCDD